MRKHTLLQPRLPHHIDERLVENFVIDTKKENHILVPVEAFAGPEKCNENWLASTQPKQDILARASVENLFRNQENTHHLQLPIFPSRFSNSSSDAVKNCQIDKGAREWSIFSCQNLNHGSQYLQGRVPETFPWQSNTRSPTEIRIPNTKMNVSSVCGEIYCPVASTSTQSHILPHRNASDVFNDDHPSNRQSQNITFIHNPFEDRQEKVSMIDKIFEMFVPAMRSTNISQEFVQKLIGLHKHKTEEEKNQKNIHLNEKLLKFSEKNERPSFYDAASSLNQSELLTYFNCIEESFIKFARSCTQFQQCCEHDQTELLKKNSLLFVKVRRIFMEFQSSNTVKILLNFKRNFYFSLYLKQYLLARYFGSDVALEQLSWLLKGCGISFPIGVVKDGDITRMSNITFAEFNKEFNLISTEADCEEQFQRYSDSIKHINDNFKYPHYYNGLIAVLLLFNNDRTYDLSNHAYFEKIFQEAKDTTMFGYEEFDGFCIDSINLLISCLREMSSIFRAQHGNYQSVTLKTNDILTKGCFEDRNGTLTQIKPIDLSKSNSKENKTYNLVDISQHIPITDALDFNEYINNMSKKFEMTWASVISGFCIKTTIGKCISLSFLSNITASGKNS